MLLSSTLLLVLAALASAQVSVPGARRPAVLSSLSKLTIPTYTLPAFDNAQLIAEEEFETAKLALTAPQVARPYKFGKIVEAEDFDFFERSQVHELEDGGRLYKLAFKSENANSIGLNFNEFHLVPGVELYVYNDELVLGAYTSSANNKETRTFAIQPLPGSTAIVELYVPRYAVSYVNDASIRIESVVHGYRKAYGVLASGSCNNDVACKGTGYEDQIRGVAMLLTSKGTAYCSGSMINNVNKDGRQLYLTAYHCTPGTSDILMFNYQKTTCGGSTAITTNTVQGLKSLASYSSSDFHLLEVTEKIPTSYNVFLNGFSLATTAPTSAFGIHHPSGDVKKISFVSTSLSLTCWSECSKQYHWKVSAWTSGTTEGGSSGSPLFHGTTKRIVGQLHGGTASCSLTSGYDSYGGIFASWDGSGSSSGRLKDVLDPKTTLSASGTSGIDGVNLNDVRSSTEFISQY